MATEMLTASSAYSTSAVVTATDIPPPADHDGDGNSKRHDDDGKINQGNRSVAGMLSRYERDRLWQKYIANERERPLSFRTRVLLGTVGARFPCCDSTPRLLKFGFAVHVIVFVLAFLRHSVLNVAMFNYKCSLTMMAPETFMPCIIYSLDFSKPSHNNNNKNNSTCDLDGYLNHVAPFQEILEDREWNMKTTALFKLLQQAESNSTNSSQDTVSLKFAANMLWLCGLPETTNEDTHFGIYSHYSKENTKRFGIEGAPKDRLTAAEWRRLHDVIGLENSVLNKLLAYFSNTFESTNRFAMVLYHRWLVFRDVFPALYSVPVAMSADEQPAAMIEVHRRTDRVILKNLLFVTIPSFILFGIMIYRVFDARGELAFGSICTWAAFLSTTQAFGCVTFIWSHLDTHLINVGRTARLVVQRAPSSVISQHYGDVLASLQQFCDLFSPVMLAVLLASGFPALTSTLSLAHNIMAPVDSIRDSSESSSALILVITTTATVCVSTLWKMSSVWVEHRRLGALLAYRKLDGTLNGADFLSLTRGSVLIFNIPITPSKMMLVPELIGGLLAAALIPVLARELQIE